MRKELNISPDVSKILWTGYLLCPIYCKRNDF